MEKNFENSPLIISPSFQSRGTTWAGYAACVWGMLFAIAHIYWALGGTWLVSENQVQESQSQFVQDPLAYALSWTLLTALFAFLSLFPLALVWQRRRLSQRRVQLIAIGSGYLGMALMAVYSFATRDSQTGLACLGVCSLGLAIAFVRPRSQSMPRWIVLIATWIFGVGMTIYGCSYIIVALLHMDTTYFLVYLITGGVNWTVEGILFVLVAWLASRKRAE